LSKGGAFAFVAKSRGARLPCNPRQVKRSEIGNKFAPFLFAYSTISFAQDLKWLLGCTRSTIPTAIFSLCTKPTALSAKIKRSKIVVSVLC
jgi:hypothetical protein